MSAFRPAHVRTRLRLSAALFYACLISVARTAYADTGTPGVAPTQDQIVATNAPVDLRQWIGEPIEAVEVTADDSRWTDIRLPVLTTVRKGVRFTAEVARRALVEALAEGEFSGGSVSIHRVAGGLRLVVHVQPRKLIAKLRLDLKGDNVDRDELLREAELNEGGELPSHEIEPRLERVRALLVHHGYPTAQAVIETRRADDHMRVDVIMRVQTGRPRIATSRTFDVHGDRQQTISDVASSYGVHAGDRLDEAALDAADNALTKTLREKGYHAASVAHDSISVANATTLRVRIETGPVFVPRFEGNVHYDIEALTVALSLADDADHSTAHLVDKLRTFYRARGFLDAEVGLEIREGRSANVRYMVFTIRERERVSVTLRTYACVKEQEIAELDEGGPDSARSIGREIDSFLQEGLPGNDLFRNPDPRDVDSLIRGAQEMPSGTRPTPVDLQPDTTYVPQAYDKAVLHLRDLYRNEGFLNAEVGPLHVIRRQCHPRSPPGQCSPIPIPPLPDVCSYDAVGIPRPVPPLDPSFTCVPDVARGTHCENQLALRLPVKLGPRTSLHDIAFKNVRSIVEVELAAASSLALGKPISTVKLEDASRQMLELYKEKGYAFADIKYTLEPSPDHTRARVLFEVHEGDQVIVKDIVIRGARLTLNRSIMQRVALTVGQPYRTSDIRKTQERLATLGVFSSVNVGLEEPNIPRREKVVIISVVERLPMFTEIRPGFSTGEGIRVSTEFGHRNLFGRGLSSTSRLQLSYLPTVFILDPVVKANFQSLGEPGFEKRIIVRATENITIPDVGLGPLIRMSVDMAGIRNLERDFILTKVSTGASLIYTPIRQVQISLGPGVEYNYASLFNQQSLDEYLTTVANSDGASSPLLTLLRFPQGPSINISQKLSASLDLRDVSFNAHRGAYFAASIEHVDWYLLDQASSTASSQGHFLHLQATISGYIPLTKKITVALQLRVGQNVQLIPSARSQTYPDRLFFLGGPGSMRGMLQDTLIPQDLVASFSNYTCPPGPPGPQDFTPCQVALRGSNLMINPRAEVRIPVYSPFEIAIFLDAANSWLNPFYVYQFEGPFSLRLASGAGIRIQTPVGPIAFDYGINLNRRQPFEPFGAFNLNIGMF